MHLIISCSLNKNSKSRLMAKYAYDLYCKDSNFIDLAELEIPFCDGDTCYNEPIVDKLKESISNAKSIIIASPVYNYDLNAAAKNLMELTGRAWTNKIVGFILAAGGKGSYMSALPFMNSLMLDFRCLIIPRFVYAEGSLFDEMEMKNELKERLEELVDTSISLAQSIET